MNTADRRAPRSARFSLPNRTHAVRPSEPGEPQAPPSEQTDCSQSAAEYLFFFLFFARPSPSTKNADRPAPGLGPAPARGPLIQGTRRGRARSVRSTWLFSSLAVATRIESPDWRPRCWRPIMGGRTRFTSESVEAIQTAGRGSPDRVDGGWSVGAARPVGSIESSRATGRSLDRGRGAASE